MKQAGVTADQTAYIGDDSVDLPVYNLWPFFAVADSAPYVQNAVDYVLALGGGKGLFVKCPI